MSFYVNITAKDTMNEIWRHVRKNSPEKVNGEANEEGRNKDREPEVFRIPCLLFGLDESHRSESN